MVTEITLLEFKETIIHQIYANLVFDRPTMEVYCPKIAKSDKDSGRNHFDQEIAPQKRKSAFYRLIVMVLGHQIVLQSRNNGSDEAMSLQFEERRKGREMSSPFISPPWS